MISVFESVDECTGCSACFNVCPTSSITMETDKEGFLYPVINQTTCIDCNKCKNVCPFNNIIEKKYDNVAFACKNKDEDIRLKSSSGGIFTILAEYVLNKNGVVFGAAFDDDFKLKHNYVTNIDELEKLRGSKYLQSNLGNSFNEVKKFLKEDRYVLFSGTPCQVMGLKLCLKKDYEKLILVDVVCHGVPSQLTFDKYLNEMSREKPIEILFRDKSNGWSDFNMKIKYSNQTYKESHRKDIYFKGFLPNLFLRPSCHNCPANGLNRASDITLGDFWGIKGIHPGFCDDKGTSVVIINSRLGYELFNEIKDNIDYLETDLNYSVNHNPCILKSVKPHKNRQKYFANHENIPFLKNVTKLTKVSIFKKFILFIRRGLSYLKRKIFIR